MKRKRKNDLKKKNYTNKDKIFEKYTKICILGKNNYNIVYKVNNKLSNTDSNESKQNETKKNDTKKNKKKKKGCKILKKY